MSSDSLLHQVRANVWEIPPKSPNRKIQTIITRLRIGHTYITHNYLMSRETHTKCPKCNAPITVHHILAECPLNTAPMDLSTCLSDEKYLQDEQKNKLKRGNMFCYGKLATALACYVLTLVDTREFILLSLNYRRDRNSPGNIEILNFEIAGMNKY
ncbi:Protein of unknown function [Cotesia congregata]|uniref:Uncharacterized protein n=1 Tax=Cotesia congregata TaxID=51543 RepID=A0A8J2EJU6_COTCN|nr:Protein of unknown function [Cotesia congregata]